MTTRPAFLLELQEAVHTLLTGDATLGSMVTGVFQVPPEGQATPYITYGQHVDGSWPQFGTPGSESLFVLDIYSQAGDDRECYAILAEVKRLLQTTRANPPPTLPDYGIAYIAYQWSTILQEPGYSLRHMPVRFQVKAVTLPS